MSNGFTTEAERLKQLDATELQRLRDWVNEREPQLKEHVEKFVRLASKMEKAIDGIDRDLAESAAVYVKAVQHAAEMDEMLRAARDLKVDFRKFSAIYLFTTLFCCFLPQRQLKTLKTIKKCKAAADECVATAAALHAKNAKMKEDLLPVVDDLKEQFAYLDALLSTADSSWVPNSVF